MEGTFSVIKSTRFVRKRQTVKLTADTDLTNDVPGKLVGALAALTRGGLLGILVKCIALGAVAGGAGSLLCSYCPLLGEHPKKWAQHLAARHRPDWSRDLGWLVTIG